MHGVRLVSAWFVLAGVFGAAILLGGPLSPFVDLPSLIIVLHGGIGIAAVAGPLRGLWRALVLGVGRGPVDPAEAAAARTALRALATGFLVAGAVGILIGMIQILGHLPLHAGDLLAQAMSVCLLTGLYALLLCGCVVWPLDAAISRRTRAAPPANPPGAGLAGSLWLLCLLSGGAVMWSGQL